MFAISYDPVPVLARFAESFAITFPLLSDEGSIVIERLGLLNVHVQQQQEFFGLTAKDRHRRLPYPGTFVLDEHGKVAERYFEQSYRDRPSGGYLLHEVGGAVELHDGASDRERDAGVEVAIWTDEAVYRPLEKAVLHVRLSLADGHHAYVRPLPEGYVPLTVRPDPVDGVRFWDAETPSGEQHSVAGLEEEFHVVDGTVDLAIPYVVSGRRHFLDGRPRPEVLPDEPVTLAVVIEYQICTDEVCHPPSQVRLQIDLPEEGLVGQS